MALFLDEQQVTDLLTMEMAIAAVEEALKQHGLGTAINNPRTRVRLPTGQLHMMGAALPTRGVIGYKAYTAFKGRVRFHLMLYSTDTGELLAVLQADRLGQMRTGAASGVATKYMARADVRSVGIFGTGWQARTQLEAVCAVRQIESIKTFGRNAERRQEFCTEMSQQLGIPVEPASTPEAVVKGMDVVITATSARDPLFDGNWLEPGAHVNAIGSNALIRREIDDTTVRRSTLIVVDSKEQARLECGDLLGALERGLIHWEQVRELGDVVAGLIPGRRQPSDLTLFESHGLAIWDLAAGMAVYDAAQAKGIGQELAV
ncbi:MAG TPA: ornithine cyclodeaminase family protein [Candidatus Tectomicrobia bacterium]|nr:ornithine cyclodeaminase family protein [Candidatus Tectomicrobia bacterium]